MNHRLLAGALLLTGFSATAQVPWVAQTTPIPTATAGDFAILAEPGNPAFQPRIVAGDPLQNGLYVYATDGGLLQVFPFGAMRGVDARSRLAFPTAPSTLVAAGAFIAQGIVFGAPGDAGLYDVTSQLTPVPTIGALTMHRWADGRVEVIADDSAGTLRRLAVEDDLAGAVSGVDGGFSYSLTGVPSALVVDDRTDTLYVAIPAQGLFRVDLVQNTVDPLVDLDAGLFGGLVGGLAFYPLSDGGGLLLTTVPSSDEVVVHELAGPTQATYLTRFRVEMGASVVRAPQHVDVVPNAIPGFDAGLFVIHDTATANYKLVPWELLATSTPVPLPIDIAPDPALPDGGEDGGLDGGEDGGADGGADAGPVDGGVDGGATDGGAGDGGTDGGAGGGHGGGTGGPLPMPVEPRGCGCAGVDPSLLFPGLLGLWIFNAIRRRRTGAV